MAGRRTGILGGTFDPVHSGHLAIAGLVQTEFELDRVIFVPAGRPRLKRQEPGAAIGHRLEMVKVAVAGYTGFEASEVETDRPGPTYTVDTLEDFSGKLNDDEFFFIVGIDVLSRFHEWRKADRILELCRLVAVSRPGYSAFDWPSFYAASPGATGRVEIVSSAMVDVSGTELRQRAAAGLTLRGLVPEPVEEYIQHHGLYRRGPQWQGEE